jgi:translation initiation factor 4A
MDKVTLENTNNEPVNNFDDIGLKDNLLRGIYSYGFENPSLIQAKSIPLIATGKDIIAQSQSGTGKTGAFTIGALQRIDDKINGVQGIIVAHTRELAIQIYDVCKDIGTYMDVSYVLCIGGQDIKQTKNELEKGTVIAIGTPGRIIDLIRRRFLSTRLLRILVIDEADEMLSFSFQDQIKTIIKSIADTTQVCLFSATMPDRMLEITEKFMRDPHKILIEKENLTLDGIKQFFVDVQNDQWKFETFCDLYDVISVSQTIVYVNSIKRGEDLKTDLRRKNFTVSLIHSNMSVQERASIMKEFRNGATRILISTDLLSRGIDIHQISIVINYDIPKNKEAYLHRIGRSGRFGKKGVAINLVSRHEERSLNEIMKHYETIIDPMPQNIQEYLF